MESNISKTAIAFNIGIKKFKKENKLSKKDMLLLLEAYWHKANGKNFTWCGKL